MPIIYKKGHEFFHEATHEIMLKKPEQERLHLQFHHPSTWKLYNLLKSYDLRTVDTSVRKV